MELFAWVGEDETGDVGLKLIMTPFGANVAVFATRRVAESPQIVQQIQLIANELNRPMRLARFIEANELRVVSPQPQG